MPVIDASVLVEYLARGDAADAAEEALEGGGLVAPHLVDAEVGHALRKMSAAGLLDQEDAKQALTDLTELPMARAAHTPLLERAWDLRSNISFYDALYVVLAAQLEDELVTADRRLARAAVRAGVKVRTIG